MPKIFIPAWGMSHDRKMGHRRYCDAVRARIARNTGNRINANAQTKRNPTKGPYISLKYLYSPPEAGMMEASSIKQRATNKDSMAGTTHIMRARATEPVLANTTDGETKIPEPIMRPTAIAMTDPRPIPRLI